MFEVLPSTTSEVYWKYTFNDIRVAIRLYLGRKQASFVQDFDTMATIVSQAFGGGGKKKSGGKDGSKKQVKSKAEMRAAF